MELWTGKNLEIATDHRLRIDHRDMGWIVFLSETVVYRLLITLFTYICVVFAQNLLTAIGDLIRLDAHGLSYMLTGRI